MANQQSKRANAVNERIFQYERYRTLIETMPTVFLKCIKHKKEGYGTSEQGSKKYMYYCDINGLADEVYTWEICLVNMSNRPITVSAPYMTSKPHNKSDESINDPLKSDVSSMGARFEEVVAPLDMTSIFYMIHPKYIRNLRDRDVTIELDLHTHLGAPVKQMIEFLVVSNSLDIDELKFIPLSSNYKVYDQAEEKYIPVATNLSAESIEYI